METAEQNINALSNTHTKCTKETCMVYALYMIIPTSTHLGLEKKVTEMCLRRRKQPIRWGE